jgi:hypothetical protein
LCIRPKNASFSSEFEFCGRGATEASKQAKTNGVFGRAANILGDRTNYKAKNIIGKNTYKFVLYIFYSIYYQVANKTRNLLFAIQFMYLFRDLFA